jgi:(2Fe-2S) ferredoxin
VIAAQYPEFTWECSHLGGDRFAATMLVLPEGLCYGRVDATDAAGLVRLYLDGRLDHRFLRGRTSLPHAVQAAQHFVRDAYGDDRIDALHPLSVEPGAAMTRVLLAADNGPVEVLLDVGMSEPLFSQCGATAAGRVRTFTLRSITHKAPRTGEPGAHEQ